MKTDRATGIMAAVLLLAFAVVRCAGPREQASPAAAGGGDAARPAQEAKASRANVAAIPPLPAEGDYDCADFETHAQAKAVLEAGFRYTSITPA